MSNIKFERIEDYRDIETINMHQQLKNNNGDLTAFIQSQKITARDNGRTPFQWDDSLNAGFSSGVPWLKVNPDYTNVNVAVQENDPHSCLNYFRRLVRLRKEKPALIYGRYQLLDENNKDVYAYTRTLKNNRLLILLNFRDKAALYKLHLDIKKAVVLSGNYERVPYSWYTACIRGRYI